ncbi:Glycoside hydrolase, 38 vacuolar alpha mannosidase [Maublancomyces gigas]|uniref:Glycoside hydrolase, 38 vacuolar alpha mannosidase n=1 Tax=Discina gigas TaxID=1032678 RepID=A0ABR3GXF8_9PEZI
MGRHTFRYAILPHQGTVGETTVRTAAEFNSPVHTGYVASADTSITESLLSTLTISGSPSIVLDHIKRGEDDEDVSTGGLPTRKGQSLILRFYDSLGGKASTTISTQLPVKKAFKTNLLEDDLEELDLVHSEVSGKKVTSIKITLRPFEVATYRLQL